MMKINECELCPRREIFIHSGRGGRARCGGADQKLMGSYSAVFLIELKCFESRNIRPYLLINCQRITKACLHRMTQTPMEELGEMSELTKKIDHPSRSAALHFQGVEIVLF